MKDLCIRRMDCHNTLRTFLSYWRPNRIRMVEPRHFLWSGSLQVADQRFHTSKHGVYKAFRELDDARERGIKTWCGVSRKRTPFSSVMPANIHTTTRTEAAAWPTANHVDPDRRTWIVPYAIIFQAIALACVVGRLFVRLCMRKYTAGADDVFIVMALVSRRSFPQRLR